MGKKIKKSKNKTKATVATYSYSKRLAAIFVITTLIIEVILIVDGSAIMRSLVNAGYNIFLDGSIESGSLPGNLNGAIQTLWTAEIIGFVAAAIYCVSKYRFYKLPVVFSWAITAFLGLYVLYFGFIFVPGTTNSFNTPIGTTVIHLLLANIYLLIGGGAAGWLLGKGLECAPKRAFWFR